MFAATRAGAIAVWSCAMLLIQIPLAAAQSYPTKPIRLVLPVAPGGGADVIARTVSQKVGIALGQQFLIDNRGGAGGNIAAEIVAKAEPDGYTLVMVLSSHAINVSLYRKLNYDPVKDFAPISLLAASPFLLVVHPSLPVHSVKEFIALSRATKGGLTYASSGSGLLAHLAMELLKSLGKFEATHIPYKGTGPAMMDTVAGHVAANFPTMISGLQTVKAGRLRAIAVTSRQRSALLPEVPTVAEQGFPDYEVNGWYGWLAPAATPPRIIALLHEEVARAVRMNDVREKLGADGAVPLGTTPDEFAQFIQSETVKWAKVVKFSGATAE
jgi:tripartite-type tricarboxylate transporter receptor subunit TctC